MNVIMGNSNNPSSSSMQRLEYDLIVIGGGSGGISSAKRAATLYKAKVAGMENLCAVAR